MQFCCIRCSFCCIRLINKLFYKEAPKRIAKVDPHALPWMWIGAELTNGKILTLTEVVNSSVEYYDNVSPVFLNNLVGIPNVSRWLYLDAKTFKEQEIPTEGLVIEDDSDS